MSAIAADTVAAPERLVREPHPALPRWVRHGGFRLVVGGAIVCAMLILALFADLLAPYNLAQINLTQIMAPPSPSHPFGTDELGRDVLSRAIHGARASLQVGVIAVGLAVVLGTVLGLAAGYWGGVAEAVVMRCMDVLLAFPALVLALGITGALGPSLGNVTLAVGIIGVPTFARLVRGETLAIRTKEFIEAARAVGVPDPAIAIRHILPNVTASIIVLASLRLGTAILAEASLSFLGMGVRPPTPSWGYMVNAGKGFLESAPWVALFPGAMIFLAVMGFNLLGDALRDILDPRQRTGTT